MHEHSPRAIRVSVLLLRLLVDVLPSIAFSKLLRNIDAALVVTGRELFDWYLQNIAVGH